jgi:hypothetical protein
MQQERLITGAEHFLMASAELPEAREQKAEPCSAIFASLLKNFRIIPTSQQLHLKVKYFAPLYRERKTLIFPIVRTFKKRYVSDV